MSYSAPRGLGGVSLYGTAPVAGYHGVPTSPMTPLPVWEQATEPTIINKRDTEYRKISDDSILNNIQHRLVELAVMSPDDTKDVDTGNFSARRPYVSWPAGRNYEIRDDGPFLQSLRDYWVRMGRNPSLWPEGEFNFGPNTDSSQNLQIAKPLYELLKTPTMWQVGGDGFVHLRAHDYLFATLLRNALMREGYLAAGDPVNAKDDGPMVGALKAFYDEGVAAGGTNVGLNYGAWPSGLNFGPNTNGDEVRIDPKLIVAVLNGWSGRGVAAASGVVTAALRNTTIRPPVIGVPAQLAAAAGSASRPVFTPNMLAVTRAIRPLNMPFALFTPTK